MCTIAIGFKTKVLRFALYVLAVMQTCLPIPQARTVTPHGFAVVTGATYPGSNQKDIIRVRGSRRGRRRRQVAQGEANQDDQLIEHFKLDEYLDWDSEYGVLVSTYAETFKDIRLSLKYTVSTYA